jgi:integrating conjugative element protein (TIGR03746 family)
MECRKKELNPTTIVRHKEEINIMSRAKNELDFTLQKMKMWRGFTLFLGVLLLFGLMVHKSKINDFTIHIPPDLTAGKVQNINHVAHASVYTFSTYIYQQINRWKEDGKKDFTKNIETLRFYLTPRYYQQLKTEYKKKLQQGELQGRIRGVSEMAGHNYTEDKVTMLAKNRAWEVKVDLNVQEWFRGMEVKNVNIQYPLKVVRFDIDKERNPWGLALDGYVSKPIKIIEKKTEKK